ncbi:kinase-like protein [Cubamyces menziesii]|nr:kinase-like protein [Cubamyces menziesii]
MTLASHPNGHCCNMIDRSDITCSRFPDLQTVKDIIGRGRTLVSSYDATVVELDGIIVKFGRRIYKSEAIAMQLVRSATPVPLPYCFAYFSESTYNGQGRCGYLVMEKSPGIPLVDLLPRLVEPSCDIIASQLHTHISSLRALNRRGTWGMVGRDGVYHGGFFSYLHQPIDQEQIRNGNPCVASSTQHVLDYFAKALNTLCGPDPEVMSLISRIDSTRPSVFSHGDLVPENILVDERTYTITSIIDWERAGWYPYFWDDSIAIFRECAYQKSLVTCELWNRIRVAAIANPSDEDAAEAFSRVLFLLAINGYDEIPGIQCGCCF